jgi:hypothetical protein
MTEPVSQPARKLHVEVRPAFVMISGEHIDRDEALHLMRLLASVYPDLIQEIQAENFMRNQAYSLTAPQLRRG